MRGEMGFHVVRRAAKPVDCGGYTTGVRSIQNLVRIESPCPISEYKNATGAKSNPIEKPAKNKLTDATGKKSTPPSTGIFHRIITPATRSKRIRKLKANM